MPAPRTERQQAGAARAAAQGNPQFAARGARYALPLILLLALALRLLLWSQPLHQPANDEVEYITVARDLLAGRGWSFYEHYHWLRAPLYNLFLAGSLWLAGGDPASDAAMHRAALPNIALSVATVYLSYRLTLALVGRRRAALGAALLTAILWTLATFASLSMAETLFTFLFTAGLLCLVRWTKDQGRKPPAPSPQPQITGHLVAAWWWVAAAGVLFGLATLTRSITLLFLPVVALWLLLGQAQGEGPRAEDQGLSAAAASNPQAPSPKPRWSLVRRMLAPALFLLLAAAVIAPWTIRNYLAYGRVIPVETGLSYNLWAFNEPHEEQETIFHVLENIPNPADRSDYATAKGLARLREDPAILARKLWPGWVYLWSVKAIEDRLIQESYYGDVGLPQFVAAFIFDDALGLLIALAGMAGLVLYRREERPKPPRDGVWRRALASLHEPKALMALWVLYAIATTMLTHAETRYRHFLYPILIPYAAWLLTRLSATRRRAGQSRLPAETPRSSGPAAWRLLGIAAIWALLGGVWLVYYPRSWAADGVSRGWHALASEVEWALGDHDSALREDERVLAVRKTPDAWLRLGDHARAMGDTRRAEKAYRSAVAIAPPYVAAVARFGDLLRALGNEHDARDAFVGDYVDQQRLVDWSWRNLGSAAAPAVAVGDGLDFGYVGGVYLPELQEGARVRWTNGLGMLRLRGPVGPAVLRLRLAAPRPDGAASVRVCVASRCQPLDLGPAWRVYSLSVDITKEAPLLVELRSDTFVSAEGRRLGILIDSASLEALAR